MSLLLFCPVCGENTHWDSLLVANDESNGLYECNNCHLKRLYPIPANDVLQGLYTHLITEYNRNKMRMANISVKYYCNLFAPPPQKKSPCTSVRTP
jgi:transcription elongation factor Elf1